MVEENGSLGASASPTALSSGCAGSSPVPGLAADALQSAGALGCSYEGYEFGGGYIDSTCIDGYLWDLDSCDEPGGGLYHGGEWPCPRCNTAQLLAEALQDAKDGGCGLSGDRPYVAMTLWEGVIAKARHENAEAAEAFLRDLPPFVTDDWPDREAVYAQPSLWDQTVEREWRYSLASVDRSGEAGETALAGSTEGESAVVRSADETPTPPERMDQ